MQNIDKHPNVKPLPKDQKFFQLFAGVYCKKCDNEFALYSYSCYIPSGIDEFGKAYYECCPMCPKEPVK
jgi:hypothetical protein